MFDISGIPILITISDKSFIDNLQVISKLVPEFEFQSQLIKCTVSFMKYTTCVDYYP